MNRMRRIFRATTAGATAAVPIGAFGGALLWGTARLAGPTTGPSDIDTAVTVAAWWALAATVLWLTASVFVLRAAEASSQSWRATRFVMPGSRSVARAILATGVLTASACSTDAESAPRLYAIDDSVPTSDPSPNVQTSIPDIASDTAAAQPPSRPTTDAPPTVFTPRNEPPALEMGVDPHPLVVADVEDDVDAEGVSGADSTRTSPTTHTVERGDNLWSIAADHLTQHNGSAPSNDEIATYWRLLIATNEEGLASGEPNLIHPGEILTLPEAA